MTDQPTPIPTNLAAPQSTAAADQMLRDGALPPGDLMRQLGVPQGDVPPMPAAAPKAPAKTLTLPSGRVATIRPGKGRDLITAQRLAKDPNEVTFGLVAVLARVDDAPVLLEDLHEMPLPDVMALVGAINDGIGEGKDS